MYFSFQPVLDERSGRAPLLDASQAAGTNVLRLGYPEMSPSDISVWLSPRVPPVRFQA